MLKKLLFVAIASFQLIYGMKNLETNEEWVKPREVVITRIGADIDHKAPICAIEPNSFSPNHFLSKDENGKIILWYIKEMDGNIYLESLRAFQDTSDSHFLMWHPTDSCVFSSASKVWNASTDKALFGVESYNPMFFPSNPSSFLTIKTGHYSEQALCMNTISKNKKNEFILAEKSCNIPFAGAKIDCCSRISFKKNIFVLGTSGNLQIWEIDQKSKKPFSFSFDLDLEKTRTKRIEDVIDPKKKNTKRMSGIKFALQVETNKRTITTLEINQRNGEFIAVGFNSNDIEIWDISKRMFYCGFHSAEDEIISMCWHPRYECILAALSSQQIKIISIEKQQLLFFPAKNASFISWIPDHSNWLLVGYKDGTMKIFEISEGRLEELSSFGRSYQGFFEKNKK